MRQKIENVLSFVGLYGMIALMLFALWSNS